MGVTGERAQFADNLDRFLEQVYASSSVPVGLGFGISTPTQAQSMANKTDAIIIGSAIVRRIGELAEHINRVGPNNHEIVLQERAKLKEWVRSCKQAIEGTV